MRHNARHNTRGPRRGKWMDLLLTTARQAELQARRGGNGTPVSWKAIAKGWSTGDYSSAARALGSLEEHGLVDVTPLRNENRRNERRPITSYRLTPSGRRRADQIMQPPPTRSQKAADAARHLHAYQERAKQQMDALRGDEAFLAALEKRLAGVDWPSPDPAMQAAAFLLNYVNAVNSNQWYKDGIPLMIDRLERLKRSTDND